MNAQSIEFNFEQSILNSGTDLIHFKKSVPLKTLEQYRKEWLLERIGKFTASEFQRLVTHPNKTELPPGAITYATEKAVELITEFTGEGFTSKDMQWGIDHELEGITTFEQRTGLKVTATGVHQKLITRGSNIGGTPDGLIGNHSGTEIKCPKSTTHFKYLNIKTQADLKATCANYYWQIQGLLYITGRKDWYFISYDPRYLHKSQQLHTIQIKPEPDDIRFLAERLSLAIQHRDQLTGLKDLFKLPINQTAILKILNIGRTKLWRLRKTERFPSPISDKPLLWRSSDIESYAIQPH